MNMVHRSLFDVVEQRARDNPQTIAAIDAIAIANGANGETNVPTQLTYLELCEGAKRFSCVLAKALEAAPDGAWLGWQDGSRSLPPVMSTWMRRGTGWYLVFCAANRLEVPLVALSNDLPDKATEVKRNAEIIAEHNISLLVVDSHWTGVALETVYFHELLSKTSALSSALLPLRQAGLDSTYCFCYTGGTTKASRCAKITTRMALHEVDAYPKIVRMHRQDRVFQQHSLYWGASAYGEIDIALAFGCALIFVEAWDTDAVAAAISLHKATCAGLVPSVLAALEPSDLPSLRLVFTWGEALQVRVAQEWARHLQLIDLLISTECWLSLYADWSAHVHAAGGAQGADVGSPSFKTVPGTMVQLKPIGGSNVKSSSGELLVCGPMVCPGYTNAAFNETSFHTDDSGTRWFCTKDCLEPCGYCGFKFAGRADDLVKVGGVWIDIRELEQRILAVDGVVEVCICSRDVFIVMKYLQEGTIQALRRALPVDFVPHVVENFPRHSGTGKVNRQLLMELMSTKLTLYYEQIETERCVDELSSVVCWCRSYIMLLWFSVLWSAYAFDWNTFTEILHCFDFIMVMNSLFVQIVLDFALRLLCLSYMLLFIWHFNDYASERITKYARFFPGGCNSLAICIGALTPYRTWLFLFAAPGICLAVLRRRLFSWPLVGLIGFPVWLRGSSDWMGHSGFRGTIRWYWSRLPPASVFVDAWIRLKCRLGFVTKCGWCKLHIPTSGGHKDPSVDRNWYCKKCWQHFYNHKLCSKCNDWSVHGKSIDQGTNGASWICWHCEKGVVRMRSSSSNVNPNAKPLKCMTIARPDPVVSLRTNGRKRAASEIECLESPTCVRRRTSDLFPSNGTHVKSLCECESDEKAVADEKPSNGTHVKPLCEHASDKHALMDEKPLSRQASQTLSPPLQPIKRPMFEGSVNTLSQVLEERRGDLIEKSHSLVHHKSREWTLLERAIGLTFSSEYESLLGLDSLHHTKLTSALRRQEGKRLSREALKRCSTLKDLLLEIERLPVERSSTDLLANEKSKKSERAAWGMMWQSKCQWVFHRSQPVSEKTVRIALQKLVERHDALRTKLRDPYNLFHATQQALTVVEILRRYGTLVLSSSWVGRLMVRSTRCIGSSLANIMCWSFLHAWPRIGINEAQDLETLPLNVEKRAYNLEEAGRLASYGGFRFKPPFIATYVPYGRDADEGALVHLAVSHMVSDGYCVVPILDDFAFLVAEEEAASKIDDSLTSCGGLLQQHLPAIPSAFGALENRLTQTVAQTCAGPACQAGSVGASDCTISREFFGKRTWRDTLTVLASIPTEVVADIRQAAKYLSVPDDIAILTIIGITLAKFHGRKRELISMIVPQRDGHSENDMVGLFADARTLTVATEGLNYVGVALRLQHIVKERLWCAPGVATQFDMTFVNFEWTDFDARQGFTQRITQGEHGEASFYPLRVAVDQPERNAWRMRVVFCKNVYNESRRDQFFDDFQTSLHGLLRTPLAPVWPASTG